MGKCSHTTSSLNSEKGETTMPRVLIRCPTTGKPLPTGFPVGSKEIFKTSDFVNNSTNCRHCGKVHEWSKEDAFLEGIR